MTVALMATGLGGLALDRLPAMNQEAAGQSEEQVLRQVDRKLWAYATNKARSQLEPVLDQKNPDQLVLWGRILEQERNYDEAEKVLKQAAQLAPGDPAPWIYLGETYRHARRDNDSEQAFARARDLAAEAVEASSDDAEAVYYLGVAEQRLSNYDQAIPRLEKARRLEPDNPLPVYQLGLTRAFQKKWKEAFDLLTEAVEMRPAIAYAYYYRGQAAGKMDRTDLLINDMNRFLTMAPEAPEAALARRIVDAAKH